MSKRVDPKEALNYGCFIHNPETLGINLYNKMINYLELLHFAERPEIFVSDLINCGVYLFSAEILQAPFYKDLANKYK